MKQRADKRKRVALYARVSTDQQTVQNQIQRLREVGERLGWLIVGEFADHGISGAASGKDRPQLDSMLKAVVRGEFDLVAAWSVDRLGRSLIGLLKTLEALHAREVDLYLDKQGIDTSTPAGKAMFQIMGVFAEFERAMIQDRVMAGLARARADGTKLGRPKTVSESTEASIRELRKGGQGILSIAKALGCGVSTVQRVIKSS